MTRDAPAEQREYAYEHFDGPERRSVVYVKDKPAERGVLVNNVISALILAVMGWVGLNVDHIKTLSAVNQTEIKNLERRVDNIEMECK